MKPPHLPGWIWWMVILFITALLGWVDWKTGIELNFFAFYFLPVGLAAWHLGFGAAVIMALLSSVVWFGANSERVYSLQAFAVWNTAIRLASFLMIGWTLSRIRALLMTERRTSDDLRRTLAEVRLLEGMLPICSRCKKIRNDRGQWQQMEVYLGEHSNAQFTHGYCPDCMNKALDEAGLKNKPG